MLTFLFTDVEGSTRLWERAPDAMGRALARHDEIIESVTRRHGGRVVRPRGEGDSRFCVFDRAPDAVGAAVEIQRALHAEPWPPDAELAVRLALHTGAAELRDGDYYGADVNRCARLRAAAHGGQSLVSTATYALSRGHLPPGAALRDLGEHHLKDLELPERIYQLEIPDVRREFPPLSTVDRHPPYLQVATNAFIGREGEVEGICAQLRNPAVRLLTLTGPGGIGKTRLALRAAGMVAGDFPDGVWCVELAAVRRPADVPAAVAQVLGVKPEGDRQLTASLVRFLESRSCLLLLDNYEHVLEAADLPAALLRAGGPSKLLVTSRSLLRIGGEHEFTVPPLRLPDLGARSQPSGDDALADAEAVRLFIERARAVKGDFTPTSEDLAAVAQICIGCDGLPLAIELAAARVRLLPPRALLRRLDRRLALLVGGARDAPARQQTLRAAIAWSADLLGADERVLFRRLAAFAGGATLTAVGAICQLDDQGNLLSLLESLVDKSLLRQVEQPDGEPRFTMLETIREYAAEQLDAAGEVAALSARHAEHYLAFAEDADRRLRGPEQSEWFSAVDREYGNLRAALNASLTAADGETAARLCNALFWYWGARGHLEDGRQWSERAARAAVGRSETIEAMALLAAAQMASVQGDWPAARAYAEKTLSVHRRCGNHSAAATSLAILGNAARQRGEWGAALGHYQEALALRQHLGDTFGVGLVLGHLGALALAQRDLVLARQRLEESLLIFRGLGDRLYAAMQLIPLGHVALAGRDLAGARARFDEGIALLREIGDPHELARCLVGVAQVAICEGRLRDALEAADEALACFRQFGARQGVAAALAVAALAHIKSQSLRQARECLSECLALIDIQTDPSRVAAALSASAALAASAQEWRRAAILLGATEALLAEAGAALEAPDETLRVETFLTVRTALDGPEFENEFRSGLGRAPGEAVAVALHPDFVVT